MRKFFSVIAFAIVATGLIIGGIIILSQLPDAAHYPANVDTLVAAAPLKLGLGLALLISGIGAGVGTIASFFTARTRDK